MSRDTRSVLICGLLAVLVAACAPARETPPAASAASGAQPASRAPAAGAPAAAALPAENVRIGYPSRSVTFLAMLLAREQGYFEQQGINAELVQLRSNVGLTALLNGEVDYTESLGTNVRSALQGAPVKIVLTSLRAPIFMLLSRPEHTSVAQLRGRSVGITSHGGTNEQTTKLLLKHYGLDPARDVQLLTLGDAPVQYEALRLGQVDSVVISLPFPVMARQEGFNLLANAADVVNQPLAGIGTLQAKLERQRDQVKRVVKAEVQALRHVRSQPDDAIALIADLFDLDPAVARDVYTLMLPSISEDGAIERAGIETVLELEREDGKSTTPLTFEQVTDTTVIAEAQRELGLRP